MSVPNRVQHFQVSSRVTHYISIGAAALVLYGCSIAPRHRDDESRTRSEGLQTSQREAKSTEDAFTMISKRMMGLNPDKADVQDHIGLVNLADMLGFKYPFNSCAATWKTEVRNGGEVSIFAPHSNNKGTDCREIREEANTRYTFNNWEVQSGSASKLDPYEVVPEHKDFPNRSAAAEGAEVMSDQADAKIVDGRLVVITPEIISVEGANNTTDAQTISADFNRVISNSHNVTITDQSAHAIGVGITVSAEGGFAPFAKVSASINTNYTFTATKSTATSDTRSETTSVACTSSITQKPGCNYRLKIIAKYVQTKARYIGHLRARPRTIAISGVLNDAKDCQNKKYRGRKGTCSNRDVVTLALGSDGISYERDLESRLSGGDTSWYWESLANLKNQKQANGSANIDLVHDYVTKGDFDQFTMRFEDVTESITDCQALVEVISGGEQCRIADPDVSKKANHN